MPTAAKHFVYYFCYGSNLLIQRMRINNKSATKHANGLLTGFKLSFAGNSQLWKGATANIVQDSNSVVYGAVYTLDKDDIDNLDRQECGYDPIEVIVKLYETNDQPMITCRTYVQKSNYANVNGNEPIPSRLYKEIIIKGAKENNLPEHYIENVIKTFKDNGIIECGPSGLNEFLKN
ncbi:gamma-glutamylcyclotransferase [Dermatophagoides farinae]|uniref:gamma-glutamylcyclotransferase n=1 Tax=Dermatophagoides farinae TaxID=6954 RepID=A0A9D4SH72_DERFA|nr:gamma-glutamylcyclotransferase-like [Dermatophagoides farinae]KAH7642309.1 hypothetical protein HUG17_5354 [Dermatophagoides farinae]